MEQLLEALAGAGLCDERTLPPWQRLLGAVIEMGAGSEHADLFETWLAEHFPDLHPQWTEGPRLGGGPRSADEVLPDVLAAAYDLARIRGNLLDIPWIRFFVAEYVEGNYGNESDPLQRATMRTLVRDHALEVDEKVMAWMDGDQRDDG